MSITYPPELLPVASPDEDAEVFVCDDAGLRRVFESQSVGDVVSHFVVDCDPPASPAAERQLH